MLKIITPSPRILCVGVGKEQAQEKLDRNDYRKHKTRRSIHETLRGKPIQVLWLDGLSPSNK